MSSSLSKRLFAGMAAASLGLAVTACGGGDKAANVDYDDSVTVGQRRVLLVWTLALMLLDVATRRVAWDRLLTRELADEIRAQALERVKSRSESAARTTTSLRKTSAKDPARQTSAEARLQGRHMLGHRGF